MDYLIAKVNYGSIKAGLQYRLIKAGKGWYAVSVKGTTVYAFDWVFD